jgi:hypothetical protein
MATENLPTPGRYLTDKLKEQYQTAISQIISDLGRPITLHLPPTTSGCPNCDYLSVGERSAGTYDPTNPFGGQPFNRPFPQDTTCPVCFGTHEIKEPRLSVWHATIFKQPKDYEYSIVGVSPENVVLTKMVIEAWEDVRTCIRAVIDGLEYQRLSEPTKIGMGNESADLKFINCYWRRTE